MKSLRPKKIKELGIKIGTKAEAMWTRVRDARKGSIESLEEALIIEKAILEMAEGKIEDEKTGKT